MRVSLVAVSLLALACATAPPRPSRPPSIPPGRPAFEGQSGGFWIWADAAGWHLRTTSAGRLRDFSGVISPIDGKIEELRPARPGAHYQRLRLTDQGIEFSLPTEADVEGFDWSVTSGCNRFDLRADGEAMAGQVRLGIMAEAPARIPFDLCR